MLDLTWSPQSLTTRTLATARVPHFRLDIGKRPFVAAATQWLAARAAYDAVVIFAGEAQFVEGLYQLIRDARIRVIAYAGLSAQTAQRIQRLRPVPTYTLVLAPGPAMLDIVDVGSRHGLLKRPDTWNAVLLDGDERTAAALRDRWPTASVLVPDASMCCRMHDRWTSGDGDDDGKAPPQGCGCDGELPVEVSAVREFVTVLVDEAMRKAGDNDGGAERFAYVCPAANEADDEMVVGVDKPALFTAVVDAIRSAPNRFLRIVADPADLETSGVSYHVRLTAWSSVSATAANGSEAKTLSQQVGYN